MDTPKITIMCGLPRSGKSTWVAQNRTDEVIISADKLRELVYGQRFFAGGEPLVWAVRGLMLEYLMQQKLNIIVDETNTTKERRAAIIKLAKRYRYYIICRCCNLVSVDTCKERAIATDQNDLLPIIDNMAEKFELPKMLEGFDKRYFI